jgi:hypothetical protein
MLPAKTHNNREPVNEYEELCSEMSKGPVGDYYALSENERRQLILAWLECADPDSVRDRFADAMEHLTARNQAEYLTNVVRGTDHGAFGRVITGYLEVVVGSKISDDINAWRYNLK